VTESKAAHGTGFARDGVEFDDDERNHAMTRRRRAAGPNLRTRLTPQFFTQPEPQWLGLGFVLLLLVGAIDYAIGFSIRLTVLYVIPLMIFTWVAGRNFGLLLAAVACLSWAYLDNASGRFYFNPSLLYWEWGLVFAALAALTLSLSHLKRLLEEARFASREDSLTGLVNAGGFYQVVSSEMEMSRRYRRPLSIAYIDLDNFKAVNDRFGHHVGDELLRVVARTMKRKLRASDLSGRLGGDEFGVMLPETTAESCRLVVEMLQQRLIQEMRAHDWPVTFSIGIATFARMPATIEDMIRQADRLMYDVKHTRKGEIKQEIFGAPAAS
jgi:diguanylate cyclase (GGDEF)-like protein